MFLDSYLYKYYRMVVSYGRLCPANTVKTFLSSVLFNYSITANTVNICAIYYTATIIVLLFGNLEGAVRSGGVGWRKSEPNAYIATSGRLA